MKSKGDGDRSHLNGLRERFAFRNADRCSSIFPVAFVFLCEIWARYLFRRKERWWNKVQREKAGFWKKHLRGVRGMW